MNQLLSLAALAALIYFATRGDESIAPSVDGAIDGLRDGAGAAIGERYFPDFSRRAAGDPLPESVQGPGPFGAVVVPPRPPPSISNRTTRVSNT